MGEAMGKFTQNYLGTVFLAQYEYYVVVHTLAWPLWHSANKSSSFASRGVAPQFWGNFFVLSVI